MTKYELRRIYLTQQKSLTELKRSELSQKISSVFFQTFDLNKIHFLHCFLPIKRTNEIDTKFIFQGIRQNFPHIETFVPRVNFQTDEIENLKFTSETNLVQNRWQIDEPAHNEIIETVMIDMILIPLLCFDRQGFRVGYGKGFYDKLLKNCRTDCLKIGLSYFPPVEKIEDAQIFDIKLDFCVLPEKIINFNLKY